METDHLWKVWRLQYLSTISSLRSDGARRGDSRDVRGRRYDRCPRLATIIARHGQDYRPQMASSITIESAPWLLQLLILSCRMRPISGHMLSTLTRSHQFSKNTCHSTAATSRCFSTQDFVEKDLEHLVEDIRVEFERGSINGKPG